MIASSSGGTAGFLLEGGGNFISSSFLAAAFASPVMSRDLARHSHRTIPMEKTSARRSISAPRACSGAMYASLPLRMPVSVSVTLTAAFAMPKSTSFTVPSKVTRMFCGLTSRWTISSGTPS